MRARCSPTCRGHQEETWTRPSPPSCREPGSPSVLGLPGEDQPCPWPSSMPTAPRVPRWPEPELLHLLQVPFGRRPSSILGSSGQGDLGMRVSSGARPGPSPENLTLGRKQTPHPGKITKARRDQEGAWGSAGDHHSTLSTPPTHHVPEVIHINAPSNLTTALEVRRRGWGGR